MEDNQREAMYNAWADSKKWMRVELYKSFGGENEWRACAEHTFGCVERPTKILAIQKIQSMLVERGYKISNLAELFGTQTDTTAKQVLKEARKTDADKVNDIIEHLEGVFKDREESKEKKLTFLEWCREIELQNNTVFYWQQGTPQHKLKDPSMTERMNKSYAEVTEAKAYREFLDMVEKISNIKINMPEGKIEYKP